MSVTIKFRKGNASEWTTNGNVVLASGEPGYELDTGRLKIGNGVTIWNNLLYSAIVPSGFIAGSGISLNLANNGSSLTINSSGATVSNYADNRILTSDGTSTGINGESNLTFNGSLLSVIGSGNFSSGLFVSGIPVSTSGHTHLASQITNFNTSVSGLLPSVSGSGYITSSFNNNTYTISATGLQPSGNYSLVGHTHASSNITDFNSSVSGLLPVKNIVGGTGIYVTSTTGSYTVGISGNFYATTGNLDVLYFNTNIQPTLLQGQMAWNDTEGTVDIALTNTAIINIGEHEMYRVRNTTGGILYKGQAVMASGVHANGIIIPNLYTANGSVREIRFMGLVYENINDNNNGYVIHFGHINNIDTRGNVASNIAVGDETWADGDILYVHPTVAGKLTKNEPKHSISAAIVLDAASNGKIFVRPISYGHLGDNHDVSVSGAANGQFLQYNSETDYWIPTSSGNFSTLLVNGTGVSVSGHTHTSSNITDFNSSVSGLLPTITNSGDNRVLTSTGTTTGINGESNLTFDGTSLKVGNPNPVIAGALVVNGNIVTAGQSVQSSIFSIYGNTNNRLEFQNNSLSLTTNADSVNHAFPYFSGSSRINRMIITSSGVGIGTDIPVSRLDVSGIITASGGNSNNWNAAHSWGNHATAGYAPLNSPSFTGTPLAPTATSGTNSTQIATTAFVRTEITNLISSAPSTLDTLNELAIALGNDPNFATTVTNSIAGKVSKSGDTMTGTLNAPTGIFSDNIQISSQTASTIAGFDSSKNVTSLSTGTYPSLTELSYVKGVTSSIQTQLNSKQATLTNPVTGTGTTNYVSKWTGSTTQGNGIIIDNGTNVGIGTGTQATSPPERLVVDGNLRLADTAGSTGNRLQLARGGGGSYDYTLSKEGNHLAISTANDAATNRFTQFGFHSGTTWTPKTVINNFNGFIGVNTLSPSAALVVTSTGNSNINLANFTNTGGTTRAAISLSSAGDGVFSLIDASNNTDILFSSNTGTSSYINAGRLGIGTTTPSGTIHIVGTGIVSSISGVSPNALWHVYSSGSGNTVLNIEGTNGSLFSVVDNLSGSLMSVNNNAGLPVFEVFSNDSVIAGRFGQNDWVVSSGGNVGIGIGVPVFKLHVIGTGNFSENLLVSGIPVSVSGHGHTTSDITNFNSGVSGLLPTVSGSGYVVSSFTNNIYTISVTGLQPSGVYASGTHTHTASQITDFNEAVDDRIGSGLFVAGTGINLNYNDTSNSFTIGVTGLINNPANNRLLTSRDNTTTGIDAENNLTFDNSTLNISGNLVVSTTGDIDTLKINRFYHQNLSISTGLANNDLLVAITDPSGSSTTQTITGSTLRSSLLNQPARLQFRQGTDVERLLITPASGEPVWTTDSQRFYIGDGTTVGGDFMGPSPLVIINSSGSYIPIHSGNNEIYSKNRTPSNCSILNGTNNLITSYAIPATGNISGPTSQIICDYDNNGRWTDDSPSGLRIDYTFNNVRNSTFATLSLSANSGEYLILDLASPVGVSGQNWTNPRIVNISQSGSTLDRHTIVGGTNNTICSFIDSAIVAGSNNYITNRWSNFIGAGTNNRILRGGTLGPNSSAIVAGTNNILAGNNSIICAGSNNILGTPSLNLTLSLINSFIGGGSSNSIKNGAYNVIVGGLSNVVGGEQISYTSIPGGFEAKTTKHAEFSHSAGKFENAGDAQHTVLIARRTTTDATVNQVLFLDNSSIRLTLPVETAWTFTIKLSAYNDTDNQGGWWIFRGGIRRNAANGTALIGSLITENGVESSLSTASASVVADDTNEALEIRVTGVASKNIRWVAVVDISQVSYGAV
jgi:hypothetical protein